MSALFVLWLAAQPAPASYAEAERHAYLEDALEALHAMPQQRLEDVVRYINAMERNKCRSEFHRLRIQCLLETARRNCRGFAAGPQRDRCEVASDLIVVNKLAEGEFVTVSQRYAIMKNFPDYRRELSRELRRRYGTLATDLVLSRQLQGCKANDRTCLAAAVDRYCQTNADARDLSWHHCAAAIIWFIGTTKG